MNQHGYSSESSVAFSKVRGLKRDRFEKERSESFNQLILHLP